MRPKRKHIRGINNLSNNPNRIYRIEEAKGRAAPVLSPEKRKEIVLKRLEKERKKREMVEPLDFSFLDDDE